MTNKEEALVRIAKAFNESEILWCVGASCMMKLRGIVDSFGDIDIMTGKADFCRADEVLCGIAERLPARASNEPYTSRGFAEYITEDGTEVDLISGFGVRTKDGEYRYELTLERVYESVEFEGVRIPLGSAEAWFELYSRMPGKEKRASQMKQYLFENGLGPFRCG